MTEIDINTGSFKIIRYVEGLRGEQAKRLPLLGKTAIEIARKWYADGYAF